MESKLTARIKALSRSVSPTSRNVAPPPEVRRKTPRVSTTCEGRIFFKNTIGIRCIVKDKSDKGLQIEMEFTSMLPDFIDIVVPELNLTTTAAVIWQDAQFAGLYIE